MAGKKVLIVDDDPVARRTLHSALRSEKFEVEVAGDTLAAVTQAKAIQPDLILLDLGLPAGGGFQFLERIKNLPKLAFVPVIVISGLDRAANEARAMAAGATEYVEKPATPERVIDAIKRVLGTE